MDLALAGMRKLKKEGKLADMEESEEINACSVIVPVEMDYGNGPETEEWLVFFKNETHNHPHGNRALRRRGHLSGRRDPRPPFPGAAMSIRPCV